MPFLDWTLLLNSQFVAVDSVSSNSMEVTLVVGVDNLLELHILTMKSHYKLETYKHVHQIQREQHDMLYRI